MADNKVNSGLLEFSKDQKVFVALDAETSEVKKAVTIDGDGVETDIAGGGGGSVTVEALNVTENGTYSEEGKAYSPVTVDVAGGSSDFSTATLTVTSESTVDLYIPQLVEAGTLSPEQPAYISTYEAVRSGTYEVLLYKGAAYVEIFCEGHTINYSGDIEDMGDDYYFITGDCAITISGADS